jgi:hypothetical protein
MTHLDKVFTTAVEDIERNAPTNTPSEDLPPHNCKQHPIRTATSRMNSCVQYTLHTKKLQMQHAL